MPKKFPQFYVIKSHQLTYPFTVDKRRKGFDSQLVTDMTQVRNKN